MKQTGTHIYLGAGAVFSYKNDLIGLSQGYFEIEAQKAADVQLRANDSIHGFFDNSQNPTVADGIGR